MRCPLMYRNVFKRSFNSLAFVAIPLLIVIVQISGQRRESSSLPPVIRHPGTCTFQRSQSACTFSLLCYLAGGTPVEGCGGDFGTTCCMLHDSHESQYSSSSPPLPPPPPSPSPFEFEHHSDPSPTHPRYMSSNSNSNHRHDYPPEPPSHPYHFGRTTPPTTEFIDYGLDHNTIRRTRPDGHVKPFFREVSNRKVYARNLQEDICGRPTAKPMNRIIGGQDAYFGEFPWQVHIKITKHQCGGALVNQQFIVTAAHCIYQAPIPQLNVIIGAHDIEDHRFQDVPPQYFGVTEVKLHPQFRFSASHPDRYDIAVLRLDRPVRYNDNILPVCLPQQGFRYEGWYGLVTGWGKTDPALSNRYGTRLLQKVEVPIIDNDECEMWHRTRGIDLRIFPEMMCAGYEDGRKDACVGDSGGPLVINTNGRWTLAGITSAGFGCAQSRQPGIYHRVSNTVDWIIDNIKN